MKLRSTLFAGILVAPLALLIAVAAGAPGKAVADSEAETLWGGQSGCNYYQPTNCGTSCANEVHLTDCTNSCCNALSGMTKTGTSNQGTTTHAESCGGSCGSVATNWNAGCG